MALRKNPKYDLKLHYKKSIEISIILSFSLVIAAFKVFPEFHHGNILTETPQDVFTLEDVQITKQESAPPPLQPPVPIESPTDITMDDFEIVDNSLKPDEIVSTPPKTFSKTEESEDAEPPFFEVVEQLPSPIGGIEAIYENLEYPPLAVKAGIQGAVKLFAYVDKNGNVTKTELIKGIGMGCDEEAMKAVSSLKFNPGMQRDKPVNVKIAMQIKFIIK